MKEPRFGMLSLRLDSIYCLILGIIVAVASNAIATVVSLPAWIILTTGVVVVLWAALVEWMRAKLNLRLALKIVMVVNIAATLAVGVVSFTAAALFSMLVILAIALDIALFAGSQALALGKLRTAAA